MCSSEMKKWSSLSQNDHHLYTRQFLLIRIWTRQKLLLTYKRKRNDIQWSLTFAISPYLTLVSSVNCWPIDQHRVTVIAMLYLYSGKCHCFFVKFLILVLIKMLIKIARIGNSRRRYWKPRISSAFNYWSRKTYQRLSGFWNTELNKRNSNTEFDST